MQRTKNILGIFSIVKSMQNRERINIILIAIDTLRADHLGCYGYTKNTSPNIDHFAGDGVVFENCFALGIPTHPAYTTIMTGKHPLIHGIVCHAGSVNLSPEIAMLPEIFNKHGYVTIAVDNLATAPESVARAGWFARGYDYYFSIGGITVISHGIKVNADIVNKIAFEALELALRKSRDKNGFFMFIHYWDPHAPYLPPKEYIERFYKGNPYAGDLEDRLDKLLWGRLLLRGWIGDLIKCGIKDKNYVDASYDAEIAYVDERVGELLAKVDELGLTENTVIVLTADHGEGLGEHEIYYDHHGLYEWDIKVPLIIRYPPRMPKGTRVNAMVSHMDIAPTLLEFSGIPVPENISGKSLLALFEEKWNGYTELCIVENTRMTKRAIRTKKWKLIETLRPDIYEKPAGCIELYDVEKDPIESVNLVDQNEDLAFQLLGRLEKLYRFTTRGVGDPLIEQKISLPVE
jgi:arylsulfatase A-like enzyme